MNLMLQYDPFIKMHRVYTGDYLTNVARQQNASKTGTGHRDFPLPVYRHGQIALGASLNCRLDYSANADKNLSRYVSTAQARLLESLLDYGAETMLPIVESIYSASVCLATQAGITDTFGIASALHLVTPSINGKLRQVSDEIEMMLPWLHCNWSTQLALAPAMTARIAAMDHAREQASIAIATIAVTTPLDVKEELAIRLKHYKATLGHLTHSHADELPNRLDQVARQVRLVIDGIPGAVRPRLRLPERRLLQPNGLVVRLLNFIRKR